MPGETDLLTNLLLSRMGNLLDRKDESTPTMSGASFDPMTGKISKLAFDTKLQTAAGVGAGASGKASAPQATPTASGGPDLKGLGLARLLSTIGGAFSAAEPQSWQAQLSKGVGEFAKGGQFEALSRGVEPEGIGGFGITPEERIAAKRLGMMETELGLKAKEETPEEKLTRTKAGIRPPTTKGLQLQTIKVGDQNVAGVFDPESGNFNAVATSPIQESGGASSLRSDQRLWYNKATKEAADILVRSGMGDIIQLADGSWTIKFNAEIAGDPERLTEAEAMYRDALNERLENLVEIGKVPESFLKLVGSGGTRPKVTY